MRNVIFAQRLAVGDELPFVINLVRGSDELNVGERMASHLAVDGPVSFRRGTWESLLQLPLLSHEEATPLRDYVTNKTNMLARAFRLDLTQ